MIKVLHVWKDVRLFHGIHDNLLTLARTIDRSRFAMSVCIYGHRSAEISDQFDSLDIPMYYLDTEGWQNPALIGKLASLFGRLAPDIVQTYCLNTNIYGGIAARRAGVPAVISCELTTSNQAPSRLRRFRDAFLKPLNNWVSDKADCRVFVADAVRRDWVGARNLDTYRIIYPAFGGAKSTGKSREQRDPGAPVIGVVARLSEEKRHVDLLDAMKRVRESFPRARLLVVGDGPLAGRLQGYARKIGLSDAVEFAGYRKEVFDELARMDLFVLPSRTEGLSVAIVEAMASGLPVVASDVGGISEVVEDGRTGLLVPPFQPNKLAGALISILGDPVKARLMGERGRQIVEERFHFRNFVQAHERMYRELSEKSAEKARSAAERRSA